MTEPAIQTDARPKSQREEALERVEAGRNAALKADGIIIPEEDLATDPGAGETSADPQALPVPAGPETFEKDGVLMVKTKIEGQEQEVPLTSVLAGYQKGATADLRLQEASRTRTVLETQAAELALKEQDIAAREAALKAAKPPDEDTTQPSKDAGSPSQDANDDLVKKYHDAVQNGDEEEYLRLHALMNASQQAAAQPPTVDVDAIAEKVVERVRAKDAEDKFAVDQKSANEAFWSNPRYEKIANDEHMRNRVNLRAGQLVQGGQDLTTAVTTASEETLAWLAEMAGVTTPPPDPVPDPGGAQTTPTPSEGGAAPNLQPVIDIDARARLAAKRTAATQELRPSGAVPAQQPSIPTDPTSIVAAEIEARRAGRYPTR